MTTYQLYKVNAPVHDGEEKRVININIAGSSPENLAHITQLLELIYEKITFSVLSCLAIINCMFDILDNTATHFT